jgi:hypothetical protein
MTEQETTWLNPLVEAKKLTQGMTIPQIVAGIFAALIAAITMVNVFCIVTVVAGIAILTNRQWGRRLFFILAPIQLISIFMVGFLDMLVWAANSAVVLTGILTPSLLAAVAIIAIITGKNWGKVLFAVSAPLQFISMIVWTIWIMGQGVFLHPSLLGIVVITAVMAILANKTWGKILFIISASLQSIGIVVVSLGIGFDRIYDLLPILFVAATIVASLAILAGKNWGRILFMVSVPIMLMFMGAAYRSLLWTEDVPYSALFGLVYIPLVFLLSRSRTLICLGVTDSKLRIRISIGLLVAFLATTALTLAARAGWPVHPRTMMSYGQMYAYIAALNAYTRFLGALYSIMPMYIGAIIAAAIPTRAIERAEHKVKQHAQQELLREAQERMQKERQALDEERTDNSEE